MPRHRIANFGLLLHAEAAIVSKSARTILIILLVILVPFLIYAVVQIRSLSQDEKMAKAIYEKQMETVLFSLNQYADDRMQQWVNKLADKAHPIAQNANDLVLGNEAIQLLVIRHLSSRQDSLCYSDYASRDLDAMGLIDRWYQQQDSTLNKLTNYLKAGFQKIQPAIGLPHIPGLNPAQGAMTVMVYDKDSTLHNALFIFDMNYWVASVLGAKMQELSQNEYLLSMVQKDPADERINSLFSTGDFDTDRDYAAHSLWILPNTYLTIQTKGTSYAELIRKRNRTNLAFLFFSLITVLIGAFLIFRNARKALKIAQLKSDFVSNVSHEIRTPLSLIRMYAETLLLGRLNSEEKKQNYYEVIHRESGRLTYLVNNILDFARIEANRTTYHKTEVDLNKLAQNLYDTYAHTLKEAGMIGMITLHQESITILADDQAFEAALSNLIDNAIKYNPAKGVVHLSTYVQDGFACCTVTDKGIGIRPENQSKIFEQFYRVEDALTQKTKGTGLGLSLVKHIMEEHHGEVTVKSKPGQGSSFTLKFPLTTNQK